MTIKFGTSGWRGIMAENFTFDNVRLCAQALADRLNDAGKSGGKIFVARDTRFLGDKFVEVAAAVFNANGFNVYVTEEAVPTPALDAAVLKNKAVAGVSFTASHNPPEYNGFKYVASWGGIARSDETDDLTRRVATLTQADVRTTTAKPDVYDFKTPYLERLFNLVGASPRALNILVNPMYGTAATYLPQLLEKMGHKVTVMNAQQDPMFGGIQPDPAPQNLEDMQTRMQKETFDVGLCTDADGDRFGIMGADGTFIPANDVLALLIDYWAVRTKGPRTMAMSLVAGTIVERTGVDNGLEVIRTPVGFKHPGKLMSEGKVIMACEESSGFAWTPHLPDKDGILTCAMMAHQLADLNQPVDVLRDNLYARLGRRLSKRLDLRLTEEKKEKLITGLRTTPPRLFAGHDVEKVDQTDGIRLDLDHGNWIAFRASGTEPLVRVYMDAEENTLLSRMEDEVQRLIA